MLSAVCHRGVAKKNLCSLSTCSNGKNSFLAQLSIICALDSLNSIYTYRVEIEGTGQALQAVLGGTQAARAMGAAA